MMTEERNGLPELPQGWVWTTIGEITQPIEKVQPKRNPDTRFTYLDISSIDNQINKVVEPKTYYGSEAPSRARQLIRANDVLFSTVRTYLKNIALVSEVYDGQIASTGFSVLRGEAEISSKYLFYYSLTDQFLNVLTELQRGTSYPAVRDSDVRAQPFPLPPAAEQHRIVAKIEELFTQLDAGVAALEKAKAQLRRYRQAVLKAAVEGELTREWREAHQGEIEPALVLLERILEERRAKWEAAHPGKRCKLPVAPDTDDLPGLPERWVWTTTGEVVEKMANGITRRQNKDGVGIPVTRIETISKGTIDLGRVGYLEDLPVELIDKYKLQHGDILFSHINSDPHLGKTAIFELSNTTLLHGMNLLLLRPRKDALIPKFLHYLCQYYRYDGVFVSVAQHAVNQSSINQAKLKSISIPLPPLPEQHHIVAEVEQRLSVADEMEKAVEQSLKQAERLRQSILKRAFEGKLVPQDSSDEPASVLLERIKAEKARREGERTGKRRSLSRKNVRDS